MENVILKRRTEKQKSEETRGMGWDERVPLKSHFTLDGCRKYFGDTDTRGGNVTTVTDEGKKSRTEKVPSKFSSYRRNSFE